MTAMAVDGARDAAGEAWVEAVLQVVEEIPPGRVLSYGEVALLVAERLGSGGGPRQVGQVMARYGAAVPWWRVVRADGQPVRGLEAEASERLRAEGTPMRGPRVVLAEARYRP